MGKAESRKLKAESKNTRGSGMTEANCGKLRSIAPEKYSAFRTASSCECCLPAETAKAGKSGRNVLFWTAVSFGSYA
jgi:hypothetical protein